MASVKRKTSSSGASAQKRRLLEISVAAANEAGDASPVAVPSGSSHALLWLQEDVAEDLPNALVLSLRASIVRYPFNNSLCLHADKLIIFPDVKRMGSQDEVAFRNDDVCHAGDIPAGY
jgi:hypothetical protein